MCLHRCHHEIDHWQHDKCHDRRLLHRQFESRHSLGPQCHSPHSRRHLIRCRVVLLQLIHAGVSSPVRFEKKENPNEIHIVFVVIQLDGDSADLQQCINKNQIMNLDVGQINKPHHIAQSRSSFAI